jgi:cytoskeleton protein RodZ
MSDAGFSAADGAGHEHTPEVEITAGKMLRSARDAAGLHVAALAVSMKIPVKKLEALEADRLDLLHDAVFVRALAASVCRALKIDPTPILNKLPLNSAPRLNPDDRGINAPFHSSNEVAGMAIPAMLTKPSTLIVLALVLAGIAVCK